MKQKAYWINYYTPLLTYPDKSTKICDLPRGTIVNATGEDSGVYAHVHYKTSSITYVGWVYIPYMEELSYLYPEQVKIDNQTENEQDLAQYIIKDGVVQFNLCGEICICYTFGIPLDSLLEKWNAKSPNIYNRIFKNGLSRPTGLSDLLDMTKSIEQKFKWITVADAFTEAKSKRVLFTPGRIEKWLDRGYRMTIGVTIERQYGRLRPSGIPHWVVVYEIIPDGPENAIVLVYNPASNRIETYSWFEFISSVKAPLGVLIQPF